MQTIYSKSLDNQILKIILTLSAFFTIWGCREPLEHPADIIIDVDTDQFVIFDTNEDNSPTFANKCKGVNAKKFINKFNPYIGGTQSVDVVVVTYSFFKCPHCAEFAELSKKIWNENPEIMKHARLYFHNFPFNGVVNSWQIHAAAYAAGLQKMNYFWKMHNYIYNGLNSSPAVIYSPAQLRKYAEEQLHLNMIKFDSDLNPKSPSGKITYDFLTWDKINGINEEISATPSVFICGNKIGWPDIKNEVLKYLK